MRDWNLKSGDPLTLTLAADPRFGPTDYTDDQIWELSLSGGDPPALAFETTYGLRARRLRLFPRFTLNDETRSDPAEFADQPCLRAFAPNMARLTYAPFNGLDVEAEYWVPESQAAAGRMTITNHTVLLQRLKLEWIGQLAPGEGERMSPITIEAAPALAGKTGNLTPVVFITGGAKAESSSFPSLTLQIELEPGGSRQLVWAHAGCSTLEESFSLARSACARRWDAENARIEMLNAGLVEVYTGLPEWDAAFALSQKTAFGLFLHPARGRDGEGMALPHPSFVLNRLPDQGYSGRGDGNDYGTQWSGQSPLEAGYLAGLILPAAPELAAGLVHNFLSHQADDGSLDYKPGLGGQLSRLMATPAIADLAWRVYQVKGDPAFLEQVFPGLLRFVQAWLGPDHDRDGDGLPEWDNPVQAGLEEHPVYSPWMENTLGLNIQTVESPGLGALLYNEVRCLVRMARILGRDADIPMLEEQAERLRTEVEATWDSRSGAYRDRDRDTHSSPRGGSLGKQQGPGEMSIGRRFRRPVRVLVQFRVPEEATRKPVVQIFGQDEAGQEQVETSPPERCRWYLGRGMLTSEQVFSQVERVVITDLAPEDEAEVFSVSYRHEDHSQLLPLWAGIPGEKRARSLVEKTITNPEKFWRSYGLPASPYRFGEEGGVTAYSVHLPWNAMTAGGLLRYGFREEAAALLTRLMDAVVMTLKRDQAFRRFYDPAVGTGLGDRNALTGLAPLGLFLEVLGVRLISPTRVILSGTNPFPWPVTVKFRGLTVIRQMDKSMVIFPDGQTSVIRDPAPQMVALG